MSRDRFDELAQEWLKVRPMYQMLGGTIPHRDDVDSLAALLRRVAEEVRERAAVEAEVHGKRAKGMQDDLLKKRDPVYGIGSALAIATAIRALSLEGLAAPEEKPNG